MKTAAAPVRDGGRDIRPKPGDQPFMLGPEFMRDAAFRICGHQSGKEILKDGSRRTGRIIANVAGIGGIE